MEKQYLECGKIVTTHGIRGEVKVQPWCDEVEFLTQFDALYLAEGTQSIQIEEARCHKNMALIKFKGIDTIEAAAALRGKVLYIDRADAPLEEGQYFLQDLLGLEVRDADSGMVYGPLTDVSHTGANDVYHIRFKDGKERLIPAIPQVIIATDIKAGVMQIRPLVGLFDDED